MISDQEKNSNPPDSTLKENIRFLSLGDSYTIGHAVDPGERFPMQLAESLKNAGIGSVQVEIIAKTGWTTGELLKGINVEDPAEPYDFVTLLIGVNNQYRRLDIEEYREEFIKLLDTAIIFAGGEAGNVIVVSIPDYGVTPFAQNMDTAMIAKEIDAYNTINYAESKKYSITYIDITPISRMAKNDPDLIAGDGLHPSGKMYAEWVAMIYPTAIQILQEQKNE